MKLEGRMLLVYFRVPKYVVVMPILQNEELKMDEYMFPKKEKDKC